MLKRKNRDQPGSSETDSPEVTPVDPNENLAGSASDTTPAREDQPKAKPTSLRPHRLKGFFAGYWRRKKWTLPVTTLVLVGLVLAIPYTRYPLLGLVIKRPFTLTIVDSKTGTPVTGAEVTVDNKNVTTNNYGQAKLDIPVGKHGLIITKQYYREATPDVFVGLSSKKNNTRLLLTATGRQVPIVITNKITGQPIGNAEITVLNTEAKTTSNGHATIVLPTQTSSQQATIKASGYNSLATQVLVTGNQVSQNEFQLVPSGRIYFLSNLSGTIDVVSTNLDGTDRQTVLKGTGNETPNTVLLASRDWKYLALLTQRSSSGSPELDLINTSTNAMTNIDQGSNVNFTLVGWDGDRFIYEVNRSDIQNWQNGQQALKSFNAATGNITVLTQTTASGTGSSNYDGQSIGSVYTTSTGKIVYAMNWDANYDYAPQNQLVSKQATLNTVNPDGSDATVVKSFSLVQGIELVNQVAIDLEQYDGPSSYAIRFNDGSSNPAQYFEYQNDQVTSSSDITDQNFYNYNNPTYLLSPSGSRTFWSEPTDGKYTLYLGDQNGNNSKQAVTLTSLTPYGWYTDNYLLVEKNGSQLYIMPTAGGTPTPIANYFKPSQLFNGYGGGYGGQ